MNRKNVLPPGTILQLMYLEERLRRLPAGRFIEIGPGGGDITQVLLDLGWRGRSFDLESQTVAKLQRRFENEIAESRFAAVHGDYLEEKFEEPEKVDLVISCMVMEHLEDAAQTLFMEAARTSLRAGGVMIGLVPGSPAHWGIEDDIAGHCRRYTRASIGELAHRAHWTLLHVAGLTFPVSNLLLPLSNFLVNRAERSKLALSALDRTKQSGRRQVKFKTYFPSAVGLVLNRVTMLPMHLIQKMLSKSEGALVLYFEVKPIREANHAEAS